MKEYNTKKYMPYTIAAVLLGGNLKYFPYQVQILVGSIALLACIYFLIKMKKDKRPLIDNKFLQYKKYIDNDYTLIVGTIIIVVFILISVVAVYISEGIMKTLK